jgi:AAA15 family ATPase/GTPase
MLYQFEVSGFKSFNEKFSFRLDGAKEYSFNREAVRNDVIKTGIVYGVNGIGKSNLGLALFDIIFHITQGFESNSAYTSNYLNLESKNDYAEFSYLFRFDEHYLKYTYRKKSLKEILFEEIQIDGETVASINKVESGTMFCSLSGADTLKTDLSETNIKSIVSYINTNAALDHKDSKNKTFQKFIEFVEKMLFFRSIEGNRYMGYEPEPRAISIDIIENGNLEDFEDFLNKAGISCKLCSIDKEDGKPTIAFDFGEKN